MSPFFCRKVYSLDPNSHGESERCEILRLGVAIWNQWRRTNLGLRPDPSGVDLSGRDLVNVDFYQTDLRSTKLIGAKLMNANLNGTDLRSADLTSACLLGASQTEVLAFVQMHGASFEEVLEELPDLPPTLRQWFKEWVSTQEVVILQFNGGTRPPY